MLAALARSGQHASAGTEPTDAELLHDIAERDAGAFGRLVERHGQALHRFAFRVLGDADDADDAVQQALLAVWNAAAGHRGRQVHSARAWLFRIALNACRSSQRRRGSERAQFVSPSSSEVPHGMSPPDEMVAAREQVTLVTQALQTLSPEAREILLLRDVEQLTGEEVCGVLALSLPAMKTRLHRARLELKERFCHLAGEGRQP